MIASADLDWGIGKDGNLLYHIPDDMRFFKEMTVGKTVVMGRSTLESLPNGKGLPDRRNIVLSKGGTVNAEGVEVCSSVDEVLEKTKDDDVMIIGGESVYREFLPYCDTAYVTRVFSKSDADRHFPDLDSDAEWYIERTTPTHASRGMCFEFVTYKRKKKDG